MDRVVLMFCYGGAILHEVSVAVRWLWVTRFFVSEVYLNCLPIYLKTQNINPVYDVFNPNLYSCFTTEILEGFDVQRTSGLGDTLRKYGYLTQAISQYYKSEIFEDNVKGSGACPPFDEFIKRCQDLEKTTVSDVFAMQLMQVLTI